MFSGPLVCTASRQIPASSGINHRNRKKRFNSTLRAGGQDGSGAVDAEEQILKAWVNYAGTN